MKIPSTASIASNGRMPVTWPNQYVGADGILRAQVFNSFVSLDGQATALRGRALVIHMHSDDNRSPASGDAGDRLACAVVK